MEDKCGGFELENPLPSDAGGTLTCLYVVDGHAGAQAATFCRDNFKAVFTAKLARQTSSPQPSICAALYDAVLELEFLLRVHSVTAGAVAAFTVLRVNGAGTLRKLYTANVGDVEVVLVDRARGAVTLTEKHTPANLEELRRLRAISCSLNAEGGPSFVANNRLVGDGGYSLAITRTLGDFACKPWATAEPSMASCKLDENFDFFFIASDGVFDCAWRLRCAQRRGTLPLPSPPAHKHHTACPADLTAAQGADAVSAHVAAHGSRRVAAQVLLSKAQPPAGPRNMRDNASAIVCFPKRPGDA